jgi:LPS-assembly protein
MVASQTKFPGILNKPVNRLRKHRLATAIFLLWSPVVWATSDHADAMRTDLDWVPFDSLTEEQKEKLPVACCGAYVAPVRTDPEADLDPEEANLFGQAAGSESEQQTRITLTGDVRLTQGNRTISTDKFFLDKETSQAELTGNIQVREPGLLFRADHADININSGNAKLENARFVIHETRVRGQAEQLEKIGDHTIILRKGQFTSCEPGDNTWDIRGSNVTLHNDKHYGTARHMRLNVKDVPVAYVPYFRFPIGPDRLTGFLFPSVSLGDDGQIDDLAIPFYWNIAPNYDATIEPRYIERHGYLYQGEFRHLSRYFESELTGSALNNDRAGITDRLRKQLEDEEITEEEAYRYKGKDRWQWNFTQNGGAGQAWKTLIDYTDVSDTDYLRDIDRGAVDLNRQAYIQQMARASYRTRNWQFSTQIHEYRLLTGGSLAYRELPRTRANGKYKWGDWEVTANHELARFDVNQHYTGNTDNLITGQRFSSFHQLAWARKYMAGFITPGVGIKTLAYQLDAPTFLETRDDNPQFAAPQFTLDTGLFFERDSESYLQTFEPRLFYLYRDYVNQDDLFNLTSSNSLVNFDTSEMLFTYSQLFRDSRFSGADRIDDANQVTLGVSTRYIENLSGIERLKLSLGEIFYLEDPEVTLGRSVANETNRPSSSALAGQAVAQWGDSLRWTQDLVYDHRENQITAASTSLHYLDDKYRIFNLGYRYERKPVRVSPLNPVPVSGDPMNQLDVSAIWPISSQWSIILRSNYDFTYQANLDTFAGFEYNDCCYRVRLLARHWADFDFSPDFLANLDSDDYDKGVFVEVQLKGMGTLAKRISNMLDKAVRGYNEREASLY